MKAKLIAITIALFFLGSLTWAQMYSIRTEAYTNLRSGPGLDRDWVETAPTGDVLQVTGQLGRWLKINRNGRELWMASWVRHSRVDGGAPPGVDNCCFIGMRCGSDQDWRRGYLAFQRDQCKHPDVRIDGGARFVGQVEAALDLLKSGAPAWYFYTVNELKTVKEVPEGILGVDVDRRLFYLPPNQAYLHNNANLEDALVWLAGVLVHEACHIYRDKEGWAYGTAFERLREEAFCQTVQIQALDAFDRRKRFHAYLSRLLNDFYSRGYRP